MKKRVIKISFSVCVLIFLSFSIVKTNAQTVLPFFIDELVSTGWTDVEGFELDATGRMYVWEKAGRVWIVDTNGNKLGNPLIDIRSEVGNWRDHGLNGFALDPDFLNNGYYYLYYTVDRHHLIFFGTPFYLSFYNDYYKATIVRVTRYQADSGTNFTTTIANSRQVLIGESASTGIPCLHESHTGGALVFGSDGSLFISTGDGASYGSVDSGSAQETYYSQAINSSIITSQENVGAFRCQMLNSFNGKLLRIDPQTGNGLTSNPFYDPLNPRSAKSRTWGLGLRNPFRITRQPGTGSTDITAGNPGKIFIGDVQWNLWEELTVCDGPGQNFGWPLYEGMESMDRYNDSATVQHPDVPNPLFGQPGCNRPNFLFKDLLKQPNNNGNYAFINPCNPLDSISASHPVFYHKRPLIDWHHTSDSSRIPSFDAGGEAHSLLLEDSNNNAVNGVSFKGNCSAAGTWYTGLDYPVEFQNTYFHIDYGGQWIKNMVFDSVGNLTAVKPFASGIGAVVFLAENKKDGALYYVKFPNQIRRIRYTANVDNPPKAIATADTVYGTSPLTVTFDGSQSFDIEGSALKYFWNFGDGTTDSVVNPVHVFTDTTNALVNFVVTLTVSDSSGLSGSTTLIIYLNNTPPVVNIISVADSTLYNVDLQTLIPLEAVVADAEHDSTQLTYAWQTTLYHNNHFHHDPIDDAVSTYTIISPTPCDEYYAYGLSLKVTDANGLSGYDEVFIYPACNAPQAAFSGVSNVCEGNAVQFYDLSSNVPTNHTWYFEGGNPQISSLKNPVVVYDTAGQFDVMLIVSSSRGIDTLLLPDYVTILATPVIDLGSDTIYCGSVTLNAENSGSQYLWNDGSTTQTIVANTSGYYQVLITNPNGCQNSDGVALTINTLPVVNLGNDSATCNEPVMLATGSVWPGYLWNTGETTDNIIAGTSGNYWLQVTDSNGCTASDSVGIIINSLPVIFLGSDTATCDLPVLLDAGDGFASYLWNDSSSMSFLLAINNGLYSVLVTDSNGCHNSDTIQLTINASPAISLGNDTSVCNTGLTVSPGGGFSGYQWSSGSVTDSLTLLLTGTYTVTVTDLNGCTASDEIVFINNALPVIILPADTFSCNLPVTLDAGNDGINYSWSNGQSTQAINAVTSGTYTVTVTNSNGCVSSNSVMVSIYALPAINLGNDTATCAQPVWLQAGIAQSYLWNNGATTSSILVNTSGIYSVIITDANGCTNADSISFINNPLPNVELQAFSFDTICISSSMALINSGVPSGGSYSGNGVTGNMFNPSQAGIGWQFIYYSYTDTIGCSNTTYDSVFVDQCLALYSPNEASDILLFPNPAGNIIYIMLPGSSEKYKAQIVDRAGQIVKASELKATVTEINISKLAAASYMVEIIKNDRTIKILTFIKAGK